MIQRFQQGHLAPEARHQLGLGRQAGRQKFHRQWRLSTVERARAIHRAHATRADKLFNHQAFELDPGPTSLGHETRLAYQGFQACRIDLDLAGGTAQGLLASDGIG